MCRAFLIIPPYTNYYSTSVSGLFSRSFSVAFLLALCCCSSLFFVGSALGNGIPASVTIDVNRFNSPTGYTQYNKMYFGELSLTGKVDTSEGGSPENTWGAFVTKTNDPRFGVRSLDNGNVDGSYRLQVGYILIDLKAISNKLNLSHIHSIEIVEKNTVGNSNIDSGLRLYLTDYNANYWANFINADKEQTYPVSGSGVAQKLIYDTGIEFNKDAFNTDDELTNHCPYDSYGDVNIASGVLNNLVAIDGQNSGEYSQFHSQTSSSYTNIHKLTDGDKTLFRLSSDSNILNKKIEFYKNSTGGHLSDEVHSGWSSDYLVLLMANTDTDSHLNVYKHNDFALKLEVTDTAMVPELKAVSLWLSLGLINLLCFMRRKPVS